MTSLISTSKGKVSDENENLREFDEECERIQVIYRFFFQIQTRKFQVHNVPKLENDNNRDDWITIETDFTMVYAVFPWSLSWVRQSRPILGDSLPYFRNWSFCDEVPLGRGLHLHDDNRGQGRSFENGHRPISAGHRARQAQWFRVLQGIYFGNLLFSLNYCIDVRLSKTF